MKIYPTLEIVHKYIKYRFLYVWLNKSPQLKLETHHIYWRKARMNAIIAPSKNKKKIIQPC